MIKRLSSFHSFYSSLSHFLLTTTMTSNQKTLKHLASHFDESSSSSEEEKKKALISIENHFIKYPTSGLFPTLQL
jgi:hypothetical protein